MPDEEEGGERDEADSGRFSEGETEEESLIDCGLKLRKVSFIEKVDDVQQHQSMRRQCSLAYLNMSDLV